MIPALQLRKVMHWVLSCSRFTYKVRKWQNSDLNPAHSGSRSYTILYLYTCILYCLWQYTTFLEVPGRSYKEAAQNRQEFSKGVYEGFSSLTPHPPHLFFRRQNTGFLKILLCFSSGTYHA